MNVSSAEVTDRRFDKHLLDKQQRKPFLTRHLSVELYVLLLRVLKEVSANRMGALIVRENCGLTYSSRVCLERVRVPAEHVKNRGWKGRWSQPTQLPNIQFVCVSMWGLSEGGAKKSRNR